MVGFGGQTWVCEGCVGAGGRFWWFDLVARLGCVGAVWELVADSGGVIGRWRRVPAGCCVPEFGFPVVCGGIVGLVADFGGFFLISLILCSETNNHCRRGAY